MTPAPIRIIEDNGADADTLVKFLEQADVSNPTHVMSDGEAAISFLERSEAVHGGAPFPAPIMIFLDLALPKKSGVEVLLWLRSKPEFKHVVAVATSENNNLTEVGQAYRIGA